MCTDGDGVARVHAGELLDYQDVTDVIEAEAAQFLGYVYTEEAHRGHLLHVFPREAALSVQLSGDRRDLRFREFPHLLPERLVLLVKYRSMPIPLRPQSADARANVWETRSFGKGRAVSFAMDLAAGADQPDMGAKGFLMPVALTGLRGGRGGVLAETRRHD